MTTKLADPRNKTTRHLPRHRFYLPDALLLVRQLQAIAWPLNYHVTLGGGILNHGYSDKDMDIYMLPIYPRPDDGRAVGHDVAKLVAKVSYVLGTAVQDYSDKPSLPADVPVNKTCFAEALHYQNTKISVDLFVVQA